MFFVCLLGVTGKGERREEQRHHQQGRRKRKGGLGRSLVLEALHNGQLKHFHQFFSIYNK